MNRRDFVTLGLAGGCSAAIASLGLHRGPESIFHRGPTSSVIPVVGDGKWIWTKPPQETGYLEPRPFELSIGVEMQGTGEATQIRASTPVPVEHPEQQIDDVRIEAEGCEARLQAVGEGAAQLLVAAPRIASGQKVRAVAHYKLTLKKQHQGFRREQFPTRQPQPAADIRKLYLQDSPGIQTSSAEVRKLAAQLAEASQASPHPWDMAQSFCEWIRGHIRPQVGDYTSVPIALQQNRGDCEEMAGIFVALCRHHEIPARLVWVPSHNWAEFYLTDAEGKGHWIPAHTGCYSWFGWTGAHELVLQKGDRVTPAHERRPQRLLEDWGQWVGRRPKFRWLADLAPLPAEAQTDAGPGSRIKLENGEWKLTGKHPLDRYLRST
ncbi:MAG: transglutaminase domain-containing protein [Pirellulaceae bacterium]|nr:transglutaminase domain-containing protein [Pirellulaceae bacterium]